MQELLTIKLQQYLALHYPDMLLRLEEEGLAVVFVQEKVGRNAGEMELMLAGETPLYEVEVYCMDVLMGSLPPSKYDYICNILEEDFMEAYNSFERTGILLYEVINIISEAALADDFDEEDRMLRYAVTGVIGNYLHHPQTAGHGV